MATQKRDAFCSFCRKNYREVGPLVEGPGDVYICGECIELSQSIIEQEKRRRLRLRGEEAAPPPTAAVIRGRIARCGGCPENVREPLVEAALEYQQHSGAQRRAILLIGPSQSSRLFFTRVLACVVDAPSAESETAALLPSSGGSNHAEPFVQRLLQPSDFDTELAQKSIVYVEGADSSDIQEALLRRLNAPRGTANQSLTSTPPVCCSSVAGSSPGLTPFSPGSAVIRSSPYRLKRSPLGESRRSWSSASVRSSVCGSWTKEPCSGSYEAPFLPTCSE
jgi:hypothetical protein